VCLAVGANRGESHRVADMLTSANSGFQRERAGTPSRRTDGPAPRRGDGGRRGGRDVDEIMASGRGRQAGGSGRLW